MQIILSKVRITLEITSREQSSSPRNRKNLTDIQLFFVAETYNKTTNHDSEFPSGTGFQASFAACISSYSCPSCSEDIYK